MGPQTHKLEANMPFLPPLENSQVLGPFIFLIWYILLMMERTNTEHYYCNANEHQEIITNYYYDKKY